SIEIRIFERGVGPTSSSGTGTCATAVASIARRALSPHLRVRAPGGEQQVDWRGEGSEITLTGPAVLVASGEAW
ncbi:MAG: diaminopimelate epimerase, partial [Acidobacteriaceae bacterium]